MPHVHASTLELLSCLIGEEDARRLYAGTLAPLFRASSSNGPPAHILVAAHELVRRLVEEDLQRDTEFPDPRKASEYLRVLLAGYDREVFVGVFLDAQHRLIASEELAHGTINAATVYPREVVKRVLHHNAAAVIFAHNHCSGIAEPSFADRSLTARLKDALGLIDVRVLDHFVVGGSKVTSFADRGWL